MRGGFTLLETMVAITLIIIAATGAGVLLTRVMRANAVSSSQLTAAYLAHEGVSVVRNIRDANYIKQRSDPSHPWDAGIPDSGTYGIDYDVDDITSPSCKDKFGVRTAGNGLYECVNAADAPFTRKVTISKKDIYATTTDADQDTYERIDVEVLVKWKEGEREHEVKTHARLYDWLNALEQSEPPE